MIKNISFWFFILIFFAAPSFSLGQIIFSEIMYDPAGTDTGYEWVEIYNTSQYSQSLESYKFCEGKPTCHSWAKDANNNFTIDGNGYGVITDDFDKFHEKNDFDGLVLVSTGFVLTNTGELLQLKNSDGNLDDSLTFNPVSGGGDGQSLSVFNELWKNSESTPGKANVEKNISSVDSSSDTSESISTSGTNNDVETINTSYVEISDMYLGKKKLKAEVDEVGVIMAGARTKFTGTAYGITGVEITGVEFFWNFGDGSRGEGQFEHHAYDFPHDYIVTLVVKSGNFTGNTKVRVEVIDPALEVSYVQVGDEDTKGYIKLKNNSGEILNIEDWMLSVDGERFLIPDDTYIDRYAEAIFPESITGLRPMVTEDKKSRVAILFPNGERFFSYDFDAADELLEKEKREEEEFYNTAAVEDEEGAEVVEEEEIVAPVVNKVTQKPKPVVIAKKATPKEEIETEVKVSVREQVLFDARNAKVPTVGADDIKDNPSKQSANILSVFSSRTYVSEDGTEEFIKSNWPFLTFLLVLMTLIFLVLYVRKKEILEEASIKNDEKESKLDMVSDSKSEASEYEIEEIK